MELPSRPAKPDLSSQLLRPLLAGIYQFDRDEAFVFKEPSHHFLLIHRGTLVGMNGETPVNANAREMAYFHPSRKNHYEMPKGTIYQQVLFDVVETPFRWEPLILDEAGAVPPVVVLDDHFEEMRALFDIMCLELGANGVAHRQQTLAALHRILALLAHLLVPEAHRGTQLDPLEWARMRMHETLSMQTRIGQLAQAAGMQVDTFIRAFKRRYGLTPRAYNKALLMHDAIRLLRESTLSIKQIALGMGWRDAKSLTENLRRHCGAGAEEIRAGAPYSLETLHIEGSPRLNIHVVPPGVRRNYLAKWILPDHVDRYSAATEEAMAARRNTRK